MRPLKRWDRSLLFLPDTLEWVFAGSLYVHKAPGLGISLHIVTGWSFGLGAATNCAIAVAVALGRICCHGYVLRRSGGIKANL